MKTFALAGLAACCVFFFASAANAQMAMQSPQIRGVFHPAVGGGADYEIDQSNGTKMPMELSIVGKESVDGKDAYWMETSMTDPKAGDIVVKMLLVVDGANSHAEKMVMMIPGRGAMSMPMGMMRGGATQQPQDVRDQGEDLGKESITVPAGTFSSEHYKMKDGSGDVWVSEDVAPYGLVKMTNGKMTILLTKQLTNVQDKITGPVTDMSDLMRGMGRAPQQ